eukprot:TRINITY_DN27707_c0_g1_i1.p1 TRINITY_DN27707_c0_g1~~TRINITY_DN27707_c0_g1_i1.p1  ORF type:complete len:906 (+),score=344.45 TRINITY_DN27707_c0_g1_i1:113-2719(+)
MLRSLVGSEMCIRDRYKKEPEEIKTMRKAAQVSTKGMQFSFVKRFEEAVDAETKIKHSKLASLVEEDIFRPEKIKIKTLKTDHIDICYQPIIQSGGVYDLKPSAESNDELLNEGVVTCSIGVRYRSYCSNIARTFFIDPSKDMQKTYEVLLGAQQACIDTCLPGKEFSEVYKACEAHIEKHNAELLPGLVKNVGFGMGLEFRETGSLLSAKNSRKIQAGMVFNLVVGIANLERAGETEDKKKTYAIQIADTVVVNEEGEPDVLTIESKSGWTDVSYEFGGEDDEDEEPVTKKTKVEKEFNFETRPRTTKADFQVDDEARKQHQADLERKLQEEAAARFASGKDSKKEEVKTKAIVAYKSSADYPDLAVRKNTVQVDTKHECVLVPIGGVMVPFHISLIKNATKSGGEEGQLAYLRLIFNTPANVNSKETIYKTIVSHANHSFVSEISYKSKDKTSIETNLRLIKELQKRIKDREKKKEEEAMAFKQEALVVTKRGNLPRLQELQMRPVASGRKSQGILEAHENGFRFSTVKGEKIDIMYNNIRHALHEPADNELIVLIHFHLKHPIMVGKKRHSDIQFYTELGEANESLDFRRSSMWDPDEIESEQREKKHKQEVNRRYEKFIKDVENKITTLPRALDLAFDIPYSELGFDGVPVKSLVRVKPSVNALVALIEPPYFVMSLDDVEIAYFERVVPGIKNFDLVFVFKDYSRAVQKVNSIPTDKLKDIKDWLDSIDKKFYEGVAAVNWNKLMKTIQDDPKGFHEDGGWAGFVEESDGEEEEVSEDESEYTEDEDDEEEEESDEELSEVDEDEDDEEEGSDEEDEEEGKDWDELEQEAKRDDKRRAQEEIFEERSSKKHKSGHKSGHRKHH